MAENETLPGIPVVTNNVDALARLNFFILTGQMSGQGGIYSSLQFLGYELEVTDPGWQLMEIAAPNTITQYATLEEAVAYVLGLYPSGEASADGIATVLGVGEAL